MMRVPTIGSLKRRLTIQRRNVVRGNRGGEDVTWTDSATVWAHVEPLRGQRGDEYFATVQELSRVSHRVIIRFRTDITSDYRFYYTTRNKIRTFNILTIRDIDENGDFLELLCEEDLT